MANTVIAVRSSSATGNQPSLGVIANGELSLNFADGILYYKTSSNTLGQIRTTQVSGSNQQVQFNDSGSFGSSSGLTYDKSTGTLNSQYIVSTNSQGDEGGEILLAKAVTNTTLVGTGVTIDVYQNKLRFFEQGGTARGAYIDLTTASAGVGTNLLSGSSAVTSVGGQTGAISNNQILTFVQAVSSTANITFDTILTANNGQGRNIRVGDDLWLGDINLADTMSLRGAQNTANAYIVFGSSDSTALGRAGSGALTYGGNTVWHAGNDGTGSGLDADYLDGFHYTAFANATFANTDYTTISATAGTYGNAAYIPVTTLTANGRVSSITNTLIQIATSQITSGVLPFAQGGTNAVSYTTGTLLTSNGTAIISLANTGTAGTYGNAAYVPVIATDAYGRVSSVTNTAISITTAQVSGLATSATTDTTNATNITTGTLGAARLPTVGTAGTYGNSGYVPVITTDAYGRVTAVTNTAISGSGATLGDVLALSIALG